MTLVDLLIEKRKREEKYFKNYLFWARKIKKTAEKNLGEVKVFLFGSIAKKEVVPGSDIDVLIISPKLESLEKKSKLRADFWAKLGTFSPFEIHLITPQEYQNWYKNFIDRKIEI